MAGHKDEALLLCCCYIEALGNGLDPFDCGRAHNFSTVLMDHGGEPTLSLILPKALRKALQKSKPNENITAVNKATLIVAFKAIPANEALTRDGLTSAIRSLPSDALDFLNRELWRGTIGSIVYAKIRNPGVHWFSSPGAVTFPKMTFQGSPIAPVDFKMLRRALDRVLAHAKDVSLRSNKWFGRM